MQRIGLFATSLFALAVLFTAACSGSASATAPSTAPNPDAQQVTLIVGSGMEFNPSTFTVQAGQPVQLTLQNTAQTPHDFSLGSGATQPVKIIAQGGQTASATFTIDKPGTYSFDCSMPGHAMAGMRGTITAQ